MGFFDTVKGVIGFKDNSKKSEEEEEEEMVMVQVPMSELSPATRERYGCGGKPQGGRLGRGRRRRKQKGPMLVTRLFKALNQPMFSPPQRRDQLGRPIEPRGPKRLTYPLPPVDKNEKRKGIW